MYQYTFIYIYKYIGVYSIASDLLTCIDPFVWRWFVYLAYCSYRSYTAHTLSIPRKPTTTSILSVFHSWESPIATRLQPNPQTIHTTTTILYYTILVYYFRYHFRDLGVCSVISCTASVTDAFRPKTWPSTQNY